MKKIIALSAVACLAFAVVKAQTNAPREETHWSFAWTNGVDHPVGIYETRNWYDAPLREFRVVGTNYLRDAMAAGEVCKISGHNWRDGRPGEPGGYYADYHPNTNFRTCQTCGICQSQDVSWKCLLGVCRRKSSN